MFDAERIVRVAAARIVAAGLAATIAATALPCDALAAQPAPASPAPNADAGSTKSGKINDLLTSLAAEWLQEHATSNPAAATEPAEEVSIVDYFNTRFAAIHEQLVALVGAVPGLPQELMQAADRLVAVDWALALRHLFVFLVFALGAEFLFRRIALRFRRRVADLRVETVADRLRAIALRFGLSLGAIGAFAAATIAPFLALDWQPILRQTVLGLVVAVILVRVARAVGELLFAPADEVLRVIPLETADARFWFRRLMVFASWFAGGRVIVQECRPLGISFEATELIGYTLGLGLVAIALETIWRRPVTRRDANSSAIGAHQLGRGVANALLSVGTAVLWAQWVAAPGVNKVLPGFWLVLVIMGLPVAILISRRAVEHLLRATAGAPERPSGVIEAGLEHGIRASLIIGAVALLAWGLGVDLEVTGGRETMLTRILHGVLATVVILLTADVLWHVMKATIDSKLAATSDLGQPNSEEARRRARLQTLLPIFRNIAFVFIIAVAVMMALAEFGVQIGPLIAGASVVGVAIGFGAQTFVRDVIAGMFYLLDDAFRVGEYIQSGNYKGTVEGFSIRSVRLRHHRGPVYTVPFSLLGAIQNQSRDWVIDKMTIGITYDSDLELARKLIKQIGLELQKDPEFQPLIIQPLKMQGVEQLDDFAIKIRLKMMTLPGEQFVIRRKAYAMIKKAFDENGIKFAFPTVQVAGEAEHAAAAAARQTLELTRPAAAQ